MELTEILTVKLSKIQMDALGIKAAQMNSSKSDVARRAIESYTNTPSVLMLPLTEEEWEYLQTVAKHNKVDVDTALRMIMEAYFMLLNMPLSKAIKPLGELREEFQKVMGEKAKQ